MYGECNLFHSFYWNILILCIHNVDTLDICTNKFDAIEKLFDKRQHFELSHFLHCFLIRVLLVLNLYQFLLKPSDTLHTQCRHIEHLHKEV